MEEIFEEVMKFLDEKVEKLEQSEYLEVLNMISDEMDIRIETVTDEIEDGED